MPRSIRPLQSNYPYHVNIRAINRFDFVPNIENLWNFSSDLLLFCSYAFKVQVHAFVLMSNHYHLIVNTPDANLDKFMNYFNRELSREITYLTGRINQKYGARYHSTVIGDLSYYHNVYKYVYRNPVEAKICNKVEEYKYSSLNFILGRERYRFPLYDTYFEQIEDYWSNLSWLNTSYEEPVKKKIRSGLRKTYFEFEIGPEF